MACEVHSRKASDVVYCFFYILWQRHPAVRGMSGEPAHRVLRVLTSLQHTSTSQSKLGFFTNENYKPTYHPYPLIPIDSQWYAGLASFPRMQREEGRKASRLIANPSPGQHTVSNTFTHLCGVFDSSALCLSNYTRNGKMETLIYLALLFTDCIMHHLPAKHNRQEIHTSMCYAPENLGGEGRNKMMQFKTGKEKERRGKLICG